MHTIHHNLVLFSYIDPKILAGDWEWSFDDQGELVLADDKDESYRS